MATSAAPDIMRRELVHCLHPMQVRSENLSSPGCAPCKFLETMAFGTTTVTGRMSTERLKALPLKKASSEQSSARPFQGIFGRGFKLTKMLMYVLKGAAPCRGGG